MMKLWKFNMVLKVQFWVTHQREPVKLWPMLCYCEWKFILFKLFLEAVSVALESVCWKACKYTQNTHIHVSVWAWRLFRFRKYICVWVHTRMMGFVDEYIRAVRSKPPNLPKRQLLWNWENTCSDAFLSSSGGALKDFMSSRGQILLKLRRQVSVILNFHTLLFAPQDIRAEGKTRSSTAKCSTY